ncbi:hypothetical protein [Azorhizobium caulinodans]|uniref:hypothetical protein n=1 Tax=Azorhizobium caulinodans TaxID=7 RepID=UPI002FBD3B25
MSDPGRKDTWIFIVLSASFFVTFLMAAPTMPFCKDTLAYIGAVGGGALGGLMTVFAGWLAWTAANKQIVGQEQQLEVVQRQLALTLDEHRSRTVRLMMEIQMSLLFMEGSIDKMLTDHFARSVVADALHAPQIGPRHPYRIPPGDLQKCFLHPDWWRIDLGLSRRLERLQIAYDMHSDLLEELPLGGLVPAEVKSLQSLTKSIKDIGDELVQRRTALEKMFSSSLN